MTRQFQSYTHSISVLIRRRRRTPPECGLLLRSVMFDSRMVRSTAEILRLRAGIFLSGLVVIQAYPVSDRMRRISSCVGNARPASRQGVSTAIGLGFSISPHTEGSCALAAPWCGTLNAVPGFVGRSVLWTIRTQPFDSKSAPSRMTTSLACIHRTTATLLGDMSGIRVFVSPCLGNNGATAFRKRTNSLSCGDNDHISHLPVVEIRRSAIANFGCRPCSFRLVNTLQISRTPIRRQMSLARRVCIPLEISSYFALELIRN